ncbi:MAG: glycerophosphodiester phosphodiesterase [Gemmatimonadaceae bacterium]
MPKDSPARIAHRGAPRERPENTLPSFARALELGADGIELDAHATRDGVVVVHHDPVPRAVCPDARLSARAIAELTYDQLRQFSVAPDVGIPTLAEVLALVGQAAVVYVELKGEDVEQQVVGVIRESAARCAIHSFDHAAVARTARLAPDIRRGLLFSRRSADPAASMRAAGALDAWPEWPLADERFVAAIHSIGGSVIAWTVNDVGAVRRLTSIGVDGLCTDDVRLIPRGSP